MIKKLEETLGKGRVEKNKDLFSYLTLRTHTLAEYFFAAETREDLIKAKRASLKLDLPFFILGGGSNLAIVSKKISGLVMKDNYQKKEIIAENNHSVDLLVSAGYPVSRLVTETIDAGLAGFEYHKGLPGTIGGAIYMNSKWTKPESYIKDNLCYAYLVGNLGEVKKVNRQYFKFGYDFSILQKTKEVLLEAIFQLKKSNRQLLKKKANEALTYRKKTQPFGVPSSGCFFKNIGTTSAGYLIDKVGLKGYKIGNFVVSNKHANFILNLGDSEPKDLLKLIKVVKEKVRKKFGVKLKEEVIIM